jgi:F-type H+-transporting ATPase subunit a
VSGPADEREKLRAGVQRQAKRIDKAEKERRSLLAQTAYLGTLGLLLVLPAVGGAYLGRWLDGLASGYSIRWTVSLIVQGVVPEQGAQLLPFIGTLWLFIGVANLAGVIPGLQSPTGDLSATVALALIVFLSVHWFGIRNDGLHGYLRHYLSPSPILLPFHLISEVTRTVALAMRLFGNIMSLELAALLVLLVAGFLVPVPLLMLHIVEAVVQAYIFGMLALLYIGGALQARQSNIESQKGAKSS